MNEWRGGGGETSERGDEVKGDGGGGELTGICAVSPAQSPPVGDSGPGSGFVESGCTVCVCVCV